LGSRLLPRLLLELTGLDPSNHVLAGRFCKIWTLAMEALAEQMVRYFTDEEQLADFVEGVKADIQNLDYQLYAYTYEV